MCRRRIEVGRRGGLIAAARLRGCAVGRCVSHYSGVTNVAKFPEMVAEWLRFLNGQISEGEKC